MNFGYESYTDGIDVAMEKCGQRTIRDRRRGSVDLWISGRRCRLF